MRRTARTAADGVGATGWLEMGGEKKPLVMSDLGCADGCGRQMGAENCADGCGRRGCTPWLEMGGEKKPLVMSDLGCADGCGRQMGAENCADGCGRRGCNGVAGNGWGEEAAGDERPWLRGRLRTANGCGELRGRVRTAWVQRGGWKWVETRRPLVMSDLGCADGCGRQMGAENCADGCGRRGCNGVAGNGWGEEAADDERPWLRGRLRTANGCGELRGRLRTAWVQRGGWKWVGRRKPLVMSDLGCADGCGRQMGAENCADSCGRRGCNGVAGNGWGEEAAGDERPWLCGRAADGKWLRRTARTAADGVGATGWLEMGGEKKPLVMSDLGCADGCGRQMGAENCADGCGRRGCNAVAGNGWGEEAAGDERPWLRGTAADGKWVRRTARMAADGVGATGWLEMGGEKKPLVMSDLGCADGCGRQMGAQNCVDGCGRRGCNGVAGNGWGEEAAGDERPRLRGRVRTANGCGELRGRLRTAWMQRSSKWVGKGKPLVMSELGCADGCGRGMGRKCLRRASLGGGGDSMLDITKTWK